MVTLPKKGSKSLDHCGVLQKNVMTASTFFCLFPSNSIRLDLTPFYVLLFLLPAESQKCSRVNKMNGRNCTKKKITFFSLKIRKHTVENDEKLCFLSLNIEQFCGQKQLTFSAFFLGYFLEKEVRKLPYVRKSRRYIS